MIKIKANRQFTGISSRILQKIQDLTDAGAFTRYKKGRAEIGSKTKSTKGRAKYGSIVRTTNKGEPKTARNGG